MRLRHLLPLAALACAAASSVQTHAQLSNCPFNIDGTGSAADALRDGVVLARYARGLRDSSLVAGTGANLATVTNTIATNLDRLDINGNGVFDEADAVAINRILFFFNTTAAPVTPVPAFATRDTATAMKAYLDGGCSSISLTEQQRAAKFLTQTTFGPKAADLAAFTALAPDSAVTGSAFKKKASTWLNDQLNAPLFPQKHYDYIVDYAANVCIAPGCTGFGTEVARQSFWKQAITGNDQLRQRLVYALSQIAVVSSNGNSNDPYELAGYLDMLSANAFGNFRDILAGVVRSPTMGRYLDHLRNDGQSTTPNENFAREVLQLFSVGLIRLNTDGTNQAGNPATYTEDVVKGFARSFTGMSYDDPRTSVRCQGNPSEELPNWWWSPDSECYPDTDPTVIADLGAWARPMKTYDGRHSAAARSLLQYDASNPASPDSRCAASNITPYQNIASIPTVATLSRTKVSKATADLMINRAIDNIFCHPNVGPFISKQLIRFFVTSTPTPEYVTRVVNVFNNNGSSVRGDMKAVIRAVLLDDEALNPEALSNTNRAKFGKLREPILRLSALLRAFPRPATPANSGRFYIDSLNSVEFGINQGPLQSPSVFNFFHPEFSPPGPVQQANALGPEFEITTTTSIAATQNFFGGIVTQGNYTNSPYSDYARMYTSFPGNCNAYSATAPVYTDCIFMDLTDVFTNVADSALMFDYVNLVLLGGRLPASVKANYVTALDSAYSPNFTGLTAQQLADRRRDRVKAALWLAVHSPEFQVQY
jgi:uncharacterized protein (DUF1800 family)